MNSSRGSNQLNLSGRRYSHDELTALVESSSTLTLGIAATDRFGDYGIVGFCAVQLFAGEPEIRDLVISCRVAQRGLERALIAWLANHFRAQGRSVLQATLVSTPRNTPLRQIFEELPFEMINSETAGSLLSLRLDNSDLEQDIVTVESGV